MYLVSFFLRQYKYPSEFSDGKKLLELPMDAYQTPEPSILQDSTLGPGHDEALANPDSKFLGEPLRLECSPSPDTHRQD